ncbi:MAG TPA: nicotinate (nicotinamide) nucleotide adenylyltransferase [Candidatus Woesebacteria bacterium]|nr:nicotinate (nicotinamide) nucleotide adenylyltransferase [Candidatus Woesebacteria bacterium]
MKILIFGGTFNPPHLGHQAMIEQVLSKPLNDGTIFAQIWLLPVGKHSFAKSFVSNEHRLAMLKLMINSIIAKKPLLKDKILIEKYELEHDGESQTFLTLEALAKQHPDCQFSFLIGADNLAQFHLWQNYELMLKKYPFYVYPRLGFSFSPLRQGMITLDNFPQLDVSSTEVRKAFANRTSLNDLLDAKVHYYIKKNNLFG